MNLPSDAHPFPSPYVQRHSSLTFNVAELARALEREFQIAGGRFVPMELQGPADFSRIREAVILNCTGYGARKLLNDGSVIPVRGQIAWLLPQADVSYGVEQKELYIVARRDGIAIQPIGANQFFGFGNDNESPDLFAARAGIKEAASLFGLAPQP